MKSVIPRKYFEVWADEQSQNSILKGLLALFTLSNIALIISLTVVANKKPYLISINDAKTNLIASSKAIPKSLITEETKRAITRFIKLKHNWNYKTLEKSLKSILPLVEKSERLRFLKANQEQIKIAKKKKIIQKFFISKPILIDEIKKKAQITGDRILIVEGLRATQPMTFKVQYTFGERNSKNPEGVYITNETLISTLNH